MRNFSRAETFSDESKTDLLLILWRTIELLRCFQAKTVGAKTLDGVVVRSHGIVFGPLARRAAAVAVVQNLTLNRLSV